MANIGVVGHGFVGKAVEYGFKNKHNIFVFDKYKESLPLETVVKNSEFIFVSVPTPMTAEYSKIDLSIVDEAMGETVEWIKKLGVERVVILKSTVVPGTTDRLIKELGYEKIIFNPEFLTEANYLEDFVNADRVVIGGHDQEINKKLGELYETSLPPTKMFYTNPTTAETVKYMANTYLAMKVIFANEYFELCRALGIDYEEVKKMTTADSRIFDSHLDITETRGFGGKCFPKDSVAILGRAKELGVELGLVKAAWEKNLKIRKVRDWEEIEGAVADKKK